MEGNVPLAIESASRLSLPSAATPPIFLIQSSSVDLALPRPSDAPGMPELHWHVATSLHVVRLGLHRAPSSPASRSPAPPLLPPAPPPWPRWRARCPVSGTPAATCRSPTRSARRGPSAQIPASVAKLSREGTRLCLVGQASTFEVDQTIFWENLPQPTIQVHAELPGVPKERLSVKLDGNLLTISGETSHTVAKEDKGYTFRERRREAVVRVPASPPQETMSIILAICLSHLS